MTIGLTDAAKDLDATGAEIDRLLEHRVEPPQDPVSATPMLGTSAPPAWHNDISLTMTIEARRFGSARVTHAATRLIMSRLQGLTVMPESSWRLPADESPELLDYLTTIIPVGHMGRAIKGSAWDKLNQRYLNTDEDHPSRPRRFVHTLDGETHVLSVQALP